MLEIAPDNTKYLNSAKYFGDILKKAKENGKVLLEDVPYQDETYTTTFDRLCRGEQLQFPELLAQLTCKYVTNNMPFLKLAPFKIEEINLKPYIVIYHQVLSDSEIKVLRKMSLPRVSRSTPMNDVSIV